MVITPTTLTVTQLLGSPKEQYVVPAYQRRYSWREKQLWELLDDVRLLGEADTHVLGSIVCLTSAHHAGINKLELVDGQQRLTTLSVLLQCILERLRSGGYDASAHEIERLLQAKALNQDPVSKIALDSLDSDEYDAQVAGEQVTGLGNACLAGAFTTYRDWAGKQSLAKLDAFRDRLVNQTVVIRLDVSEGKDAFKLFETINNRGLRLSPTDIVKNFILGNAARFGPAHLDMARKRWAHLIKHLDSTSTDGFFRHYLCIKLRRRITISFVISQFKSLFMKQVVEAAQLPERRSFGDGSEDLIAGDEEEAVEEALTSQTPEVGPDNVPGGERIPFSEFLEELVEHSKAYGEIVRGQTSNSQINRHLRSLRMIKAQQTYGFLTALRVGGCSDSQFLKVLGLTEAFLLRRHICRARANENETAFARLCDVDCKNPLSEVTEIYRSLSPSDERFQEDFATFDFAAGLMERARYCLEVLELSRHGEYEELLVGGSDLIHVEHIIPKTIKTKKAKEEFGDWVDYLGPGSEAKHPRHVSRIGNLTLVSGPLNIGMSNNPYTRKKKAYRQSSIKLTNSLPDEYPEFRFKNLEARSLCLAAEAVKQWPVPSEP